MDRFIAVKAVEHLKPLANLKSNMDRFIELKCSFPALRKTNLKSNMDRFIVKRILQNGFYI